jgi:riboflavin kinase/FMN adenylyltransferase
VEVVRWPGQEPVSHGCAVVTLGVFDGVHVGHAAILARVVGEARARHCRSGVVTFDRHPAALLGDAPQPAITSIEHRIRLFEALGLDLCVVVEFTERVAAMGADEFARAVFHDLLQARLVVLGRDGRFGRGREGDADLCRRLGADLGFGVETVAPVRIDGARVSSTAIRSAIRRGSFALAQRLLGRPYSLYGTVVRGAGRGWELGYPTANLDVHNEAMPPEGVYAAWAFTNGEAIPSAVSIGRRETFSAERANRLLVEVHLLGRSDDLYGRDLEVRFVRRIREQRRFATPEELSAQIARDVEACREALAGEAGPA